MVTKNEGDREGHRHSGRFCMALWRLRVTLKVHKNENFFGFDLEFFTISMLVMHKKLDFSEKIF
jgi:hypothetical protein